MDASALKKWLAEPRSALVAAVAEGIRAHVAVLRARGIDFYGYALLPGDVFDLHRLVAATNSEKAIKVAPGSRKYRYYRYSVDEWARYDHDHFAAANALLVEANKQFKSLCPHAADDLVMDDYEIDHADVLLDSIVRGMEAAKASGVFGNPEPFLILWMPDSGGSIMVEWARRLNSKAVAAEFKKEFGA